MDETKAENMPVGDSTAEATETKEPEASSSVSFDETPSRSKDLSKTLPEEAFNNFIQGKRHILVHDYTFAVQSLATACELYTKHFGELALECGEVYFLYGKSLIRLSQQQSGILGDALNKAATVTNDDEDGDSSDEEEKENGSESGEGNEEKESDDCKDKEKDENKEGNSDPETMEAEEKEPSESTDSPQQVENEAESKEKETEPTAPESDISIQNESNVEENQAPEEDDLELAWNILETAKSIFLRQGENNAEAQLKIAEILQLLAEISLETDNYPAALNDLQSCLTIQQKHLPKDDRLLAHTYYEMGLAHMLQKNYDGALDNFTKTKEIFELRRENLQNTTVKETVGGFEAADKQKEIEDIESIISDIKEKIEDTKELKKNDISEIKAIIGKEKEIEVEFGKKEQPDSNSKPVSNITHLLKRKKPDEEEKESASKRVKISPVMPNGDTTVTE